MIAIKSLAHLVQTNFNGAEAKKPRKCRQSGCVPIDDPDFNGAEAKKPRKFKLQATNEPTSVTSMGPRQKSLGNTQ